MLKTLVRYITPQSVIITTAIVALLAVFGVYVYVSHRPAAAYVNVSIGPITEEVDTTGTVQAAQSLDLSFDVGGRVATSPAVVGSHVVRGQMLSALAGADLAANLAAAQAALAIQQAKLDGLKTGARPEDVAVSQTAVSGAETGVTQAKQSVLSAAQDAYVKADDAIHNKVDQFMDNPRTSQPHVSVTFANSQTENTVEGGRVQMETVLRTWQAALAAEPTDPASLDTATLVTLTRTNLNQISAFLDQVASGLSSVTLSAYVTNAAIQGYQSNIATARANISGDLSAVNGAATAEKAAESALASAQSQLTLKQAGVSSTDLEAQEASVAAAQAAVDLAAAQVGKTVIRAPIGGTVTRNDAKIGQTVTPGVPLVTIDSDAQFQIQTYVSETDLGRVSVGQKAEVRMDAYGDSVFPATVITVDPAATMHNDIASYKVTLQFDASDPRLKTGLTGNIRMLADTKSDALIVPSSAIITRGLDHYVLKKVGSGDALTKVTVGISGADNSTEILSGISAGDTIRTFGNQ